MMEIKNLKKYPKYLKDYVLLRNAYSKTLLTDKVTIKSTKEWLQKLNVDVLISIEKNQVIGACIIHCYRDGEITIFVKNGHKGIGTLLLTNIESIARSNKLDKIWAWTDLNNENANNFFKKNGFTLKKAEIKIYNGKPLKGNIFEKTL